ncbi:hypothetical protein FSP39_019264 [Pinctada imbricata]|uniref:Uncharacterized protein n=1 Tax=Pinctada imbricata TaxID=66713 RepID=A0AA89C7T0_PINIB|nr:hypothetical protein FSP39_019264 [Pinctada imbricata]
MARTSSPSGESLALGGEKSTPCIGYAPSHQSLSTPGTCIGHTPTRQVLTTPGIGHTPTRQVLTPTNQLRQRLEQQWKKKVEDGDCISSKTSPTLNMLRMTPGRVNHDKEMLISKHQQARQNADSLSVGGGVSLWPNMDDMRLSCRETLQLAAICFVLFVSVIFFFQRRCDKRLKYFLEELQKFDNHHPIHLTAGQEVFVVSLTRWHSSHMQLLDKVQNSFDVSVLPTTYIMYMAVYVTGMGTLVFYLADNVLSKNKMSPSRIKRWMCLLTVIGTWTVCLSYMLLLAYLVELTIQRNIHTLTEYLGKAINSKLDLQVITSIVEYWRIKCLTPSPTTLSIMGVVYVRDVIFYLQYYLVPVVTVLGTPIFKLVVSIYHIYSIKRD